MTLVTKKSVATSMMLMLSICCGLAWLTRRCGYGTSVPIAGRMAKGQVPGVPFYMGSLVIDHPCDWEFAAVVLFTIPVPRALLERAMDYRRN